MGYGFHLCHNFVTGQKKGVRRSMKSDMQMNSVYDVAFRTYGRILSELDVNELIDKMKETSIPEDVIYIPSKQELEVLPVFNKLQQQIYGGLPIQVGYCNGHNQKLNALEYHRSSEINVAVTDLILLLGKEQDIEPDYTYDTSKVEAFFVPAGTAIECFATTLHYAPCGIDGKGFQCVVVLPKGTNESLANEDILERKGEYRLLTAVNKWLIAHKEANIQDAYIGLKGKNLEV
jgi:hypothetical protein